MEKSKTIIQPPSNFSLGFKELWLYRELFYFFTWRDIKVKYKQTYLGFLWVILQPLTLMLLFTFVFKNLKIHNTSIRYEVYVFSGIILWNFFNSSISNAAESIINQPNIIRKIYFPRLIIPCSSILTALFDLCISFILFMIFCIAYNEVPSLNALLYIPFAFILLLLSVFGISILLSALNAKYRDFRYVIPFLLQCFFFSSQIIFSLSGFHSKELKYLLAINPLNGVIELFRYPYTNSLDYMLVTISLISGIILTSLGIFLFRKTESYFADII